MIKAEELKRLRSEYPDGTRVILEQMNDVQSPPVGTHGTVYGIDDCGSILVCWDNGSMLSVVLDAGDIIRKAGDVE